MSTSIRPRASQSQTPAPVQRGPDGRAIRLTSIRDRKQGTPFRLETPIIPRIANERPKPQCRNKECPQSKVEESEGKLVCMNCGFVLQESQITQELTFGEASNGAAIVQGAYVGQDEEVARNPAMAGNRIGGGMSSREQTERNGSHFMNSLVQALRLQQIDKERGMKYFKLASSNNFIQGRITRYVAAVCLYLACRGEQDCKVMLIDFSDILEVNVFKLGQIYNDLVETLHLNGQDVRGNIFECNPENLIQRFAQDLEFGPDEHRIANEAVQILKRMRRDWIYTGRRPAGVCGAAIILAARMNNYRRTVREVVYTAKVADVTINKRLDEFKFTDSSKLTVDEFRHHGVDLQKEHDPPAYYQQFDKQKKRKGSKRKRSEAGVDDEENNEDSEAEFPRASVGPESPNSSPETRALTREQEDSRAMPPPAIPIDPQLQSVETEPAAKRVRIGDVSIEPEDDDEPMDNEDDDTTSIASTSTRRGAGRPKGAKNKPLPVKTAAAIADEEQTERDLLEALEDPENQAEAERYHLSILPTPPPTQTQAQREMSTAREGEEEQPQEVAEITSGPIDLDSIILYYHEFEDDPEVRDCLLPPEDVAIKEAVWVTNNGGWLKEQQARRIKRELAERSGTAKVPQKRRRHRKRLGDMTEYDIQNEDGTTSRPTTAAEATRMMLQKRGYSKKINYEAIVARAYNRTPSEASGTPPSEPVSFLHGPGSRRKSSTDNQARNTAKKLKEQMDRDAVSPSKTPKKAKATPIPKKKASTTPGRTTVEQDAYEAERSELAGLAEEAAPLVDDEEEEDEEEDDVEEDEIDPTNDDDDFTDYGDEI